MKVTGLNFISAVIFFAMAIRPVFANDMGASGRADLEREAPDLQQDQDLTTLEEIQLDELERQRMEREITEPTYQMRKQELKGKEKFTF